MARNENTSRQEDGAGLISTEESRDGAAALMAVASNIDALLAAPSRTGQDDYFERRASVVAALIAAAGPMPDRATGAMQALAEIVVGEIQDACEYDLKIWRPSSMKTPGTIQADRQAFYDLKAAWQHGEPIPA